jgi:hypothetical protein
MIIIHTGIKKSKKRKPSAKQRELRDSWEKMLKKYESKSRTPPKGKDLRSSYSLGKPACRETPKIPSLPFSGAPCFKKENPVYTGTMVKGIGTMHKSNAVPIFSDDQAVDIAKMRRG